LKRVLVTGGSGFVGAHIVHHLLEKQLTVYVNCRPETHLWRLRKIIKDIELYQADVRCEEQVEKMVQNIRPEAVVHCAAYGVPFEQQDMQEMLNTNLNSTLYLIKAAAKYGVDRFIHTGSCSEFNAKSGTISELIPPNPSNFYGVSKAASTLLALQQANSLNLKLVVLRLFNLYGMHENPGRVIPAMLHACIYKKPLDLTSGEQIRDYTFIEDIAALYTDLVIKEKFPSNDVFHIGTGIGHSIREIGKLVEFITQQTGFLLWGKKTHRPNEMPCLVADISKAKQMLGWSPKTTLEQGIKKMTLHA
jgi:nucleoside-diphosphate-sugar epimerase